MSSDYHLECAGCNKISSPIMTTNYWCDPLATFPFLFKHINECNSNFILHTSDTYIDAQMKDEPIKLDNDLGEWQNFRLGNINCPEFVIKGYKEK